MSIAQWQRAPNVLHIRIIMQEFTFLRRSHNRVVEWDRFELLLWTQGSLYSTGNLNTFKLSVEISFDTIIGNYT